MRFEWGKFRKYKQECYPLKCHLVIRIWMRCCDLTSYIQCEFWPLLKCLSHGTARYGKTINTLSNGLHYRGATLWGKNWTWSLHRLQRSDTLWYTIYVYMWGTVQKISLQHIRLVRGSPKNKFTTHKTNIHMVTFNNRDSTLFYNIVPTKTEAFVQLWD